MFSPVTAFFSCSFRDADKPVNDLILGLCRGFGIDCRNVDSGDPKVPADAARTMIEQSQVFIAVAVARDQVASTANYSMPAAVRDEIGAAFQARKPMLLFREHNVPIDGFMGSYSTHLEFRRDELQTPDFLRRAVSSIDALKLTVTAAESPRPAQGPTEFFAEKVSHAISVQRRAGVFWWRHSALRKIVFTRPMLRPLNIYRWNDTAIQSPAGDLDPIDVDFEFISSSRKISMTPNFNRRTAFGVDAHLAFSATPAAADFLEYYVNFAGPHLCNTFLDDVKPEAAVTIRGKRLATYEGIFFGNQAREFELEFRFAREYGLSHDDIELFAGLYSGGLDYVDEDEIARAVVSRRSPGGDVCIQLNIKDPHLGYMYGIAWTPPKRPTSGGLTT
jgi:hypothetical protein